MTSLEIYGLPESLITGDEAETSMRGEKYLHEVAMAKAIRDELVVQHQKHSEKLRRLGSDAFRASIDLVLKRFGSELLTPVADEEGRTDFDFGRIGPAFFHTFSLVNSGQKFDLFDPISFDIDILRSESGWAEVMRALSHNDLRGKSRRFRFGGDDFDPQNIQSILVCGVLESITYEESVLIGIDEGRWEKKCSGKTRSVLLVSDSEVADSVVLLVGVGSLHPQEVVEVFKSGYFPKIFRGEGFLGRHHINFEERIDLKRGIDLASLIGIPLSENKHERVFVFTRDLFD